MSDDTRVVEADGHYAVFLVRLSDVVLLEKYGQGMSGSLHCHLCSKAAQFATIQVFPPSAKMPNGHAVPGAASLVCLEHGRKLAPHIRRHVKS